MRPSTGIVFRGTPPYLMNPRPDQSQLEPKPEKAKAKPKSHGFLAYCKMEENRYIQ
jgi:hypothetical protein